MRHLILVLGDQLDRSSSAFQGFDRSRDQVWMAEVEEEATHVWCHKARIVFFLSAMRHFRDALRREGIVVHYHELGESRDQDRGRSFVDVLTQDLKRLRPEKCLLVHPGDHRVLESLTGLAERTQTPLEIRPDEHFLSSPSELSHLAAGKRKVLLEHFYRHMRRKLGILLGADGRPIGGRWNFDRENRNPLRPGVARSLPRTPHFAPDDTTRQVIRLAERRFAAHPGTLERFSLPVTREDALRLRDSFISDRLAHFGGYQDAMVMDEPFLAHSRLSAPLNVKLLNPREVIEPAIEAWEQGQTPLNSVEGFVRQVIGWREYVRGIYWLHMPNYANLSSLEHDLELPPFYWDGQTQMTCVRQVMKQVLEHAYAHHIQRLMVLGLFALLLGAHPRKFHEWHLAMYADAVDWVSLPNALGMSQYGDGGIVGTKPYCASGAYIRRMSDYCAHCRYDPADTYSLGACPFTVLYWDFLDRHAEKLRSNARMRMQLRNLEARRRSRGEFLSLKRLAERMRERPSSV